MLMKDAQYLLATCQKSSHLQHSATRSLLREAGTLEDGIQLQPGMKFMSRHARHVIRFSQHSFSSFRASKTSHKPSG